MRIFFLILFFLGIALGSPTRKEIEIATLPGRIIGGEESKPNAHPWQISLQYGTGGEIKSHFCGGSVIDSTHILTAAHCVDGYHVSDMLIIAGAHNMKIEEPTQQRRNVESFVINPDWNIKTINNDVAILILVSPLILNEYVKTIVIASQDHDPFGAAISTGWGITANNGYPIPDGLQEVELSIFHRKICEIIYGWINPITSAMICANSPCQTKGACNGDSGSPLVCSRDDETEGGFLAYQNEKPNFDFMGNEPFVFKQQQELVQNKSMYKSNNNSETDSLARIVNSPRWVEMTYKDRIYKLCLSIGKGLALICLLYIFVCSLDLLSLEFRLIGGRTAGEIFRKSELLQNPVVGVTIGILTTVLVQSSSTSTSIIVSMVSANFLDIRVAIPIIMGANIGTSITNIIVSFSQAGDREHFRRAFAGATILDMFNWITVIVLLLLEVTTGFLYHLSGVIMRALMPDTQSGGQVELLSVITKPFVNLNVQLDKNVLECWSTLNCTDADETSLIRKYCSERKFSIEMKEVRKERKGIVIANEVYNVITQQSEKCNHIFVGTSLSDGAEGAIILVVSLIALCACLILIVKVLNSVLQGQMANVIKKTLNADIPHIPWLTGYLAILIGALMTFLVQSSSVFTSALTPLVGLGLISLKRVYPLTLGSIIGTTTTALIASMAVDGDSFFASMQIALCHLLFNATGIILFYPIPFTRIPIQMARYMGDKTAKYKWFAVLYMIVMFVILPLVIIGLSLIGSVYVIIFISLLAFVFIFIEIINFIRIQKPNILPNFLQSWKWLPLPFRSLEPYDKICIKIYCCFRKDENKPVLDDRSSTLFSNKVDNIPIPINNNNDIIKKTTGRLNTFV